MKSYNLIAILTVLLLSASCGNKTEQTENSAKMTASGEIEVNKMNRKNLVALIEKRELALEKGDTPDNAKKKELIEAYFAYGNRFKSYKNADEYLFRGARLCSEAGMVAKSIKYFDKLYNNFPEFKDRPLVLFMKAFVLENHAHNLEQAKLVYEQFLKEYPTHEMAEDATISIANLGKTPEQIIREFEIRDSLEKLQSTS